MPFQVTRVFFGQSYANQTKNHRVIDLLDYLLNSLISPSYVKYLHMSPPIRALDDHKL